VASGDVTAGRLGRGEPLAAARGQLVSARQAASKVPQITIYFWTRTDVEGRAREAGHGPGRHRSG
jgi:hypothetical protein